MRNEANFKVFQSSNIHSGSYDPETQTMTIRFGNGSTYNYASVPPEVWSRLTSAPSPGQYFHGYIKPVFTGSRAE